MEAEASVVAVVNGVPNGVHTEITDPPPASTRPKMYNIDLERIHAHLYRGKYLTTQDFLDDLGKIVHNATVFSGDNERLVKAQMMYTTAQVHTNEFDSHFRLECERMAARERKRREEWAAANPKPPGPSRSSAQAMGIRRSARNNGQQPEVLITDPVQLERRLKRQRSSEPSGESQDEIGQDALPSSKKARVTSGDEDDAVDPLDVVGPTSSQPRPLAVRFAHDPIEQRMVTPPPPTNAQEEDKMILDTPTLLQPPVEVSTVTPHVAQPEIQPRTPSPSPGPQPTFTVSDHHLHTLSEKLAESTGTLTVEQLEQLRAACLSCVWRRRSEWHRDEMVQELLDIVHVFVAEIGEDELSNQE